MSRPLFSAMSFVFALAFIVYWAKHDDLTSMQVIKETWWMVACAIVAQALATRPGPP